MITKKKVIQKKKELKIQEPEIIYQYDNPCFFSYPSQYRAGYISAAQGSGKSVLVLDMINKLSNPKKTQIFWCSSLYSKQYKILTDMKVFNFLKDYQVQYYDQDDIKEGFFKQLDKFLENKKMQSLIKKQKPDQNLTETQKLFLKISQPPEIQIKEKKVQKEKYVKNILVIDDLKLGQKQQEQLYKLLKVYRHRELLLLSTTQEICELMKQQRNLFQVQFLGPNINRDRLELIHKSLKSKITFDDFMTIYQNATDKPYCFLIIDSRGNKTVFQQNFDYIFDFKKQNNTSSSDSDD